MSRPTFSVEPLVRIVIVKIGHDQVAARDVWCRLMGEIVAGRLPGDVGPISTGYGRYLAYFKASDAPAIVEWLKQHADEVKTS